MFFKRKEEAEKRELQLRNSAMRHAVEAHRGRLPSDIAEAAEIYYNFLKGNKNNGTGTGN